MKIITKLALMGMILMIVSCSDNTVVEDLSQSNTKLIISRSSEIVPASVDYKVSPEMVCKYLSISRKGYVINKLTPVVRDADTLAYIVQYPATLGWDLISGDSRIAPILASSDSGVVNVSDSESSDLKALQGMINMVQDMRYSTMTEENQVWVALESKPINRIALVSSETGMWIAIDTISDNTSESVNHIIATKWGQGSPWNEYTPLEKDAKQDYALAHCYVGCPAVAMGQYLYHYRKNDHQNIAIPTRAVFKDSTEFESPVFACFSVNGWNSLVETSAESNTSRTAIFLSYIGNQLETQYQLFSSGIPGDSTEARFTRVLDYYKLEHNIKKTYSLSDVVTSLKAGNPILTFASTENSLGHSFIIDRYKRNVNRTYVTYFWDADYKITQEDIMYAEPWRFEESVSGSSSDKGDYLEVDLYTDGGTMLSMNWGYDGRYDNVWYRASSFVLQGDDKVYTEVQSSPYWSASIDDSEENLYSYTDVRLLIFK